MTKPNMTKGHYVLIADAFRKHIQGFDRAAMPQERHGAIMVARTIAAELEGSNPSYDRARFLKACGCGE